MKKKELIDFLKWMQEHPFEIHKYDNEKLVDLYIKSINSTRRSERRAYGSNSKAKEVCYNIKCPFEMNKDNTCLYGNTKCTAKQTD